MRKSICVLAASFALAITSVSGAFAADEAKSKPAAMPAGMDEAAMQKMMALGSPSENHKLLESLVGEWTHTVTMKMQPDAPAQESSGTNTNKWIMDGRFIQEEASGSMDMGGKSQPFLGLGIVGYDNMNQEFTAIWIDNMMTGIMTSKGQYDAKTKTITEKGTMSCPMSGEKNKPFRSEVKLIDNDNYTYSMYTKDKSGKEFKSIEVVYKRKK